eukprot:gene25076-biopygen10390
MASSIVIVGTNSSMSTLTASAPSRAALSVSAKGNINLAKEMAQLFFCLPGSIEGSATSKALRHDTPALRHDTPTLRHSGIHLPFAWCFGRAKESPLKGEAFLSPAISQPPAREHQDLAELPRSPQCHHGTKELKNTHLRR